MKLLPLRLYQKKNSPSKKLLTYKLIGVGSLVQNGQDEKETRDSVVYSSYLTGEIFISSKEDFIEKMEEYEESETSPTSGMNLKQRIEHVGGTIKENSTVVFGSIFAVDAFVQQNLRDVNLAAPYDSGSNIDSLVFSIDPEEAVKLFQEERPKCNTTAIYTVKGKGGRYLITNILKGAGKLKHLIVITYRCLESNKEYVRDYDDFLERMELVP